MITADCPLCAGPATIDEALTTVSCETCGSAEVAPDPVLVLDAAA